MVEKLHLLALVALQARVETGGEHAFGVEARIEQTKVEQRPSEQARRREHRHRECDLDDYEGLGSRDQVPSSKAGHRILESGDDLASGRADRGGQAEREPSQQGGRR